MGTRGTFGAVIDGERKLGYNQYDSYPEGHGVENLRQIRALVEAGELDSLRLLAKEARLVDEKVPPSPRDKRKLAEFTDLNVSNQSEDDWYCLTRNTHGSILTQIRSGYILDMQDFALDSLFCEWGYIVDLDNGTFDVYKGFNKSVPLDGLWAGDDRENNGYYPIDRVLSYSLDDLPTDDEFIADAKRVRD